MALPKLIQSGVPIRVKAACARQLAILIDAGLPLLRAIRILADRNTDPHLSQALQDVADRVERGSPLAAALAAHSTVFDELFVNMVKTGETGGSLDVALNRLAQHYEREYDLRLRVRNAILYPVTALLVAVAVVCIIVVWVVPQFVSFYEDAGVSLPWQTRLVQAFGEVIVYHWWLLLLMLACLYFLYQWYAHTPTGRQHVDRVKLKFPRVSDIYVRVISTRVAATLATLVQNGIPLVPALRLVGDTVGNVVVADVFNRAASSVEAGERLTETLEKSRLFPPLFIDMVGIGEEAGAMDVALERVTDVFERESRSALDGIVTLIQPALVVILGVAVILLALAVLMPYFEMQNVILGD